jgi:DNA-binding CsgD family transcriptional regulator
MWLVDDEVVVNKPAQVLAFSGAKAAERLQFMEAAYDLEAADEEWLTNVIEAAARVWGAPKFGFACAYDVSDTTKIVFEKPIYLGPAALQPALARALDNIARLPPASIAATNRTVPYGFGRPLGVLDPETLDRMAEHGASDIFALHAIDPRAKSCTIGLGVERSSLREEEAALFAGLNAHLAAAHRCRRRLREPTTSPQGDWEALFHQEGRLLEARGEAKDSAEQAVLDRAARRMQAARLRAREDESSHRWAPRGRGRWTVVDSFVEGGERYVVARENQSIAPGLDVLTTRERQIVASAAIGKAPKEIAHELGISYATVRVLLARARNRLGVRNDQEFRELPIIKALRGS